LNLKATDLVVLGQDVKGDTATIQPTIFDMHSRKNVGSSHLATKSKNISLFKDVEAQKTLLYTFSFFPNSLSYGFSDFTMEYKADSGSEIKKEVENEPLLGLLTSFSLTSIEHPMGFSTWDISYALYPTILFNYWNREYSILRSEPLADGSGAAMDQFSYRGLLTLGQASGSVIFHTPVGAFSVVLGIGPGHVWTEDSDQRKSNRLLGAVTFELGYSAFFTREIFGYVSAQAITPMGPQFASSRFTVESANRASVGLGYFLPTMRSFVRNIF